MEKYNEVIANGGIVCYNSLGKKISCFKTGGSIDVLIRPINTDMLKYTLNELINCNDNFIVIGQASNILFDDNGYRGSVVLTRDIKGINVEDNVMRVACGETLMSVAKTAKANGLGGMEKLSGIPGTIAGAVVMNAGCFGEKISDIFEYADVFCGGEIKRLYKCDMGFDYRYSFLKDKTGAVVIEVGLKLINAKKTNIAELMQSVTASRKAKQPNEPSLGSVFKNHGDISAAKLIEDCGLKGFGLGGAKISEKHANFIINTGHAASGDYISLCKKIKNSVMEKFGIELKREVIFLSEYGEKY